MTYIKKKEIIPPKPQAEKEVVTGVQCDICKKLVDGADETCEHGDIEWDDGMDVSKTAVKLITGWSCSDGGAFEMISFHICPDCFESKLIPAIKGMSEGIEPFIKTYRKL